MIGTEPAAAAGPGFQLDVSWHRPASTTILRHPSKVRVGDTVTIQMLPSGVERVECASSIQALPSDALMSITQRGGDACVPWTFVMPPTPSLGTLYVHATGHGYVGPDDVDGLSLGPVDVTLAMETGGSHQPFSSTFPHLSWAPIDFLGANSASFGVPLTFAVPSGATEGCSYAVFGEWNNVIEVRPLARDTCPPWQLTLPDLRPEPFRAGALATEMMSVFGMAASRVDETVGVVLGGGVSTPLTWSPTAAGGGFSSNLPSITFPEAMTPRYALTGQPAPLVPEITGMPDGATCRIGITMPGQADSDFEEVFQTVSDGTCPGLTRTSAVPGQIAVMLQLHLEDGDARGWSQVTVDVVEPMSLPVVDAGQSVVEGDDLNVSGHVAAGVPMGYAFSLAPSGTTTATADSTTTAVGSMSCGSGSLDPRLAQDSATARCSAGVPGTYGLAVRFTDVTGVTKTTTRPVTVLARAQRIAGADRYGTAAAVSAATFAPGAGVAYVATGASFPDALSAGPLAARDRGPVLLVTRGSVPAVTMSELKRLKPKKIIVLGGTSAVSSAVASTLASVAPVTRIAGADRYDTSARLSATFATGVPVAYVATGANFPDALAGVPAAARGKGPLLLVSPYGIPGPIARELERLKPRRIVILGGTSVVSSATATALDRYTTGSVTRRAGANRYETAVAVSKATFPSARVAYVAVGTNFPDALGGGPAAAIAGGPMLLVTRDSIPAVVRSELLRLGVDRVVILGGTSAISATVASQLKDLID
ncbi:MAG: cell wall-binding repeat-containing protein [Chloroflexota bacterium]|nr:cell wall-binding repeat-containing protein [Chloroflexota bacterium]